MGKYNSYLFIPANKRRYLHNKEIFKADAIIIDFEDSIIENEISIYIDDINQTLNNLKFKNVYLRINPQKYIEIVQNINLSNINGVMIPKFFLSELNIKILKHIKEIEKEILILIESPKGILDLPYTLQNYNIEGVFLGSEDYISNINAIRNKDNMFFPRSNIINISKAFGVKCYDTVFPFLNEEDQFKDEVDTAVEMGFDGKLAIHPSQLDYINIKFKPNTEIINKYKKIVKVYYDNIKKTQASIIVIDGKVIEAPHIKRYERIIEEYENGGQGNG